MIIIYGSKLYGKVDVVPGLFHVETKFGHLWYIPLVPVGTYLIFSKSGDNFNGVQIPMSLKSVCYAWLRAGTMVAALVGLLFTVTGFKEGPESWVTPAIITVSAIATFAVLSFHRGSTHASYSRACQLGEIIGISEEGQQLIDQLYRAQEVETDPFAQEEQRF